MSEAFNPSPDDDEPPVRETVATPDAPIFPAAPVRRCAGCYYVLEHLGEQGACPECGRSFDLNDPHSYTLKPPFLWWTFWLPALVTAFIAGLLMLAVLIPLVGFTWSTVLAVPFAAGTILGYRFRAGPLAAFACIAGLTLGFVFGLASLSLVGVFCGIVLGMIFVAPIVVGLLIGLILRQWLKSSGFSQRAHLPILIVLPVLGALIEGRHDALAPHAVVTTQTIAAPPEAVWQAIQFYEEVKHRPPWLLRLTPSFRPLYTMGASEQVGDVKICVYERGRLVKRITEVVPGRRLAFEVIEQTRIENNSVRLIDGAFELAPSPDGRGTIVTLTTRYRPLLTPRFAFLPAEERATHTLHAHVLEGMRRCAEERCK